MAGSIKLFRLFRTFHQTIGIQRNTIFFISSGQFTFTAAAFLVYDAESFFDYGFGFFALICIINTIIIHLLFVLHLENTFKYIDNCEKFIETRKCHSSLLQ